MNEPENFSFDVRVRARALKKGLITDRDVKGHLDGLPDLSEAAEDVTVPQPGVGLGSQEEPPVTRPLHEAAGDAPGDGGENE